MEYENYFTLDECKIVDIVKNNSDDELIKRFRDDMNVIGKSFGGWYDCVNWNNIAIKLIKTIQKNRLVFHASDGYNNFYVKVYKVVENKDKQVKEFELVENFMTYKIKIIDKDGFSFESSYDLEYYDGKRKKYKLQAIVNKLLFPDDVDNHDVIHTSDRKEGEHIFNLLILIVDLLWLKSVGFQHGDVKEANIILTKLGYRLIDFETMTKLGKSYTLYNIETTSQIRPICCSLDDLGGLIKFILSNKSIKLDIEGFIRHYLRIEIDQTFKNHWDLLDHLTTESEAFIALIDCIKLNDNK